MSTVDRAANLQERMNDVMRTAADRLRAKQAKEPPSPLLNRIIRSAEANLLADMNQVVVAEYEYPVDMDEVRSRNEAAPGDASLSCYLDVEQTALVRAAMKGNNDALSALTDQMTHPVLHLTTSSVAPSLNQAMVASCEWGKLYSNPYPSNIKRYSDPACGFHDDETITRLTVELAVANEELAALRKRVGERDASVLKAVRHHG